jgi:hypothetical protein
MPTDLDPRQRVRVVSHSSEDEQVVGATADGQLGQRRLAPHGVDRDALAEDQPQAVQHVEHLGERDDLVLLVPTVKE